MATHRPPDRTPTVTGLDHCGNSPRMALTADLVVAWAGGGNDDDVVGTRLADDVSHTVLGPGAADSSHGAEAVARSFRAPGDVERLTVHGLLSHGKESACDGTLTLTDGSEVDFAHHFSFASAGKQAGLRSIRTYLIPRAA